MVQVSSRFNKINTKRVVIVARSIETSWFFSGLNGELGTWLIVYGTLVLVDLTLVKTIIFIPTSQSKIMETFWLSENKLNWNSGSAVFPNELPRRPSEENAVYVINTGVHIPFHWLNIANHTDSRLESEAKSFDLQMCTCDISSRLHTLDNDHNLQTKKCIKFAVNVESSRLSILKHIIIMYMCDAKKPPIPLYGWYNVLFFVHCCLLQLLLLIKYIYSLQYCNNKTMPNSRT